MKKALSVLLIAAACFGFYGSAVTVNDILACKDYWEEAGEKSTADMNKLEDGLNQLKENEQAYLDGQEQLAEGEKTLAEGEAAYAAAPGQLAAGQKQLSEGEKSYSDLKKLIKGLQTARKHGVSATSKHDKYWHDAFTNALKPGRQLIEGTVKGKAALLGVIDQLAGNPAGTIASRFSNTSQSYPKFDSAVVETAANFKTAAAVLSKYKADLFGLGSLAGDVLSKASAAQAAQAAAQTEWVTACTKAGKDPTTYDLSTETDPNVQALFATFLEKRSDAVAKGGKYTEALTALSNAAKTFDTAYAKMNAALPNLVTDSKTKAALKMLFDSITVCETDPTMEVAPGTPAWAVVYSGLVKSLEDGTTTNADTLKATFDEYINMLDYDDPTDQKDGFAQQFETWDKGYQTLAHAKDGETSKEYPDDLASKKSGIPFAFKNMVTNSTLKAGVKKYDPKLMKILKKYSGDKLKNDSMEEFDADITYLGKKVIPRALKVLAKVKKDAAKQLADGRKQLAEGKASYAAAPGQLEAGRQQLADGKAQLAQYEDGEQQVRDGLATLFNTDPDLELESIADRLGGDGDFDNGDNHLDIDEGLNAVEVGRGYQADDGVLITKEIMGRAVATGGLLGAGVLAVLAAILSFLKKNKAAAVSALLAAAAGAFGAFYGPAQGTYFSDIAGSTVGTLTWIAAGVLGAVALVHAIVHFAAPKNA